MGDLRETTQTHSPLSLPLPLLSHPSFFLCCHFFNRPADCGKLALFRVWKVIKETTQLNWVLSVILESKPPPSASAPCGLGGAHLEVLWVSGHNKMYSLYLPTLSEAGSWLSPDAGLSHVGWMVQTRRCRGGRGWTQPSIPVWPLALFPSPEERWSFPAHRI